MDDGVPTLEVGFAITTGASEAEILRLAQVMDSTEAKIVSDAAAIERATAGMVNLGGATANIRSFGNDATRELQNIRRETANAEKSGERYARQLQRQVEVFGKSASEIRNMRAEQRALVAESSGLTELAGRIRGLNAEMNRLEVRTTGLGNTGKLTGHHMTNLAFQFQDLGIQMAAAAGSSAPLKMALMALIQQGTQIQGIAMQSGVGMKGIGTAALDMGKSVLSGIGTLARAHPILAGIIAVATAAAASLNMIGDSAKDKTAMEAYARSLGLTAAEIRQLDDVTVTWGDTAKAVFQVAGAAIWSYVGPAITSVWDTMKEWVSWIFGGVKAAANFLIGAMVGAYKGIRAVWAMLPAAMGDVFFQAVNKAIEGINWLIKKGIEGINWMVNQANKILPDRWDISPVAERSLDLVKNQSAGAAKEVAQVFQSAFSAEMNRDWIGAGGKWFNANIVDPISKQAVSNAEERIRKQALERGFLDPEKGKAANKGNGLAERLEREADATEAQIRNLLDLAAAYKISGAAALIAEARVKAESEAIRKQGDISEFVARQVQLAIAQRVSDAAKSTAGLNDQASALREVNAEMAKGNLTAERAAELVKDQIADLPLLAAIEAAQQEGLAASAAIATQALEDQRFARKALRAAEEEARFRGDERAGKNRLAELREELRLVGATNSERVIALATLKATQEAESKFDQAGNRDKYIAQQVEIVKGELEVAAAIQAVNDQLSFMADKWDLIAQNVQRAGQGMADAFGSAGGALGDMASLFAGYKADQEAMKLAHAQRLKGLTDEADKQREIAKYNLATSTDQIALYGDMAAAAKGFFAEGTSGYKALATAEKVFRAIQFAMSVKAMAQDAIETVSSLAKSGARTAAHAVEAVAKAIASLPFPANIAAGAATIAALAGIGITIAGSLGGGSKKPETNSGTGTVFGDASAKSESIKNAIDALKDVDVLMLNYSRQMAGSLHSIESQIGGFASLLVRNADSLNASGGVAQGFKANAIGSVLGVIPLIGGVLKSLFGTSTTVVGSGLFGNAQSIGSILSGGFDASYYSDIQKKKKFFGITTGTSYSTQYSGADAALENQFTMILRSFNDAILAAAGPLGAATSDIEQRLSAFVVNIGRIDLQGLTGEQIEEKLNAVFGAAADSMAQAAFPMITQFQKVGEGAFETLVRVTSTLEAVGTTLEMLGQNAQTMSIAAKMGLADQFESVSDLTNAVDAYFQGFYTKEEQAAARTAQMARVFESLGLAMPASLAAFRALVEAQDLTTAAGQATYATLLQLAPAFADLKEAMEGAKSAADIASERADLERQLLELRGDTAALRALELARLDPSNRAMQEQIWAIKDAQEAAKAADELREAWQSVGDSIMEEVKRIRGLSDVTGASTFAALMGQFNAVTAAARGGDLDAAKSLPQLSQALLAAAADAATSRQELDRIRAQTAASLEATYGLVSGLAGITNTPSTMSLLDAAAVSQGGNTASNDNVYLGLQNRIDDLVDELAGMRADNNAGHAATAANTGAIKRKLDDVTQQSGGDAIATVPAAA